MISYGHAPRIPQKWSMSQLPAKVAKPPAKHCCHLQQCSEVDWYIYILLLDLNVPIATAK